MIKEWPWFKAVASAAGTDHSCVWTSDGSVFTFGEGSYGSLGHPHGSIGPIILTMSDPERDIIVPKRLMLSSNRKVAMVSAGLEHTLICTHDGSAFSFGETGCGKLGVGESSVHILETPMQVTFDAKYDIVHVVKVGAGHYHSAWICSSGRVFTCGAQGGHSHNGVYPAYMLGHTSAIDTEEKKVSTPTVIEAWCGYDGLNKNYREDPQCREEFRMQDIALGPNHTVVLSRSGSPYVFGRTSLAGVDPCDPQYGLNQNLSFPCHTPIPIKHLENVRISQIASGESHTLFSTLSGEVFTVGSNNFGQLGKQPGDKCLKEIWTSLFYR